MFDARKFPFGWEQPGFDDSAWGSASIMGAPRFGVHGRREAAQRPLRPALPAPDRQAGRRAPPAGLGRGADAHGPGGSEDGDPVKRLEASLNLSAVGDSAGCQYPAHACSLPRASSARITLDMGRIVMGQVQFTVQAPAGTIIDLSYTEDPLRPPRGMFGGMHSGTRYYARGENDRFSVYDALGFRYANLLVHGTDGQGHPAAILPCRKISTPGSRARSSTARMRS